jgi:nucleotide-binding universal stress UspA family protein
MSARPTILAPVDFSDASRGALRYARVIAEHFGARLVILAVEDPLLTEAIDLGTGHVWDPEDTRRELAHFVSGALGGNPLKTTDVEYEVAVGKPAKQILQIAKEKPCDLIIMSTHGLTGMRKMFFGSTTERVLRETAVPVLAVPATDAVPHSSDDIRRSIGRILVPVDLSPASVYQVQVARALSEALKVSMLATYVVEPVRSPLAAKLHLPSIELERKTRAEDALAELLATVPRGLHPEALVAYGDPAEEIAKVARDRHAGLIVIGLHGSPMLGPRMGSVTYRVLCLVPSLVLALPPKHVEDASSVPPALHSFVHK